MERFAPRSRSDPFRVPRAASTPGVFRVLRFRVSLRLSLLSFAHAPYRKISCLSNFARRRRRAQSRRLPRECLQNLLRSDLLSRKKPEPGMEPGKAAAFLANTSDEPGTRARPPEVRFNSHVPSQHR